MLIGCASAPPPATHVVMVNAGMVGPPSPEMSAAYAQRAKCRGFVDCVWSFEAHHPVIYWSLIGAVVIAAGHTVYRSWVGGNGRPREQGSSGCAGSNSVVLATPSSGPSCGVIFCCR
jgi:hypothetical protein